LLPAIEHALQNAEPGPLTAELFGELLLTQSYDPELMYRATDESRDRDPASTMGCGPNCVWFLVWDYGHSTVTATSFVAAYYVGFNSWKGVTNGN